MPIMISMTRYYNNSKLFCRFISVLFHSSAIFLIAVLVLLLVSVTSCEEKPTLVGSGLLPESDFITVFSTDTIGVDASNLYLKSVRTNNLTYSYLGRLYDPFFGTTYTDFVGQLSLSNVWPGGGVPTVDSVYLYFSIVGAKGTLDTITIRKVKIYEINEILSSSVDYYSDRSPDTVTSKKIGEYYLPAFSKDTTKFISVKIDDAFGTRLLEDTTKLTQDDDANDFRSYFGGLYFTMDTITHPVLVAIPFSTTNMMIIRVYYSNPNAANLSYDFNVKASSVRYNRYIHHFSTATEAARIKHYNDGTKDTMIYLQAFDGVFPQIRIPGLEGFKKMLFDSVPYTEIDTVTHVNVTRYKHLSHGYVNKARLTFSVFIDSINYTPSTVPPQILMRYTQSDNTKATILDYLINSTFFGGTINTTQKTYSFNIASFVQEYLEGNIPQPVIEMVLPEGEYKNVILKANQSHPPVKFEFSYTRF
jgi:hypothetical protein